MKRILVISMLTLAACSLGKRTENAIYAIRPAQTTEQGCKTGLDLQVSEPTASPGLDSRRIAVYENAQRLNYFKDARWTAPAPEMLQTALIEGFEKSGMFKSVSTDMDAANVDLILLTDIRSYELENKVAKVRFVSKLIDAETRDVKVTIESNQSQTPSEYKMEDIIEAFSTATNNAVADVVEKTRSPFPNCK